MNVPFAATKLWLSFNRISHCHVSKRSVHAGTNKLYTGFYKYHGLHAQQRIKFIHTTPNSNLTQLPRQKFQDEISRLFDEYKSTESVGNIANKMNDCERCQFVIQRFLQPFTERLMPIHPNIKCYVEIEKEKELLNAISAITGVSTGSLKQYYKELAEYKIDERDLTIFHDSFQSNGKISYCSVSEIAYDICEWIGPCGEDIDTNAYVRL